MWGDQPKVILIVVEYLGYNMHRILVLSILKYSTPFFKYLEYISIGKMHRIREKQAKSFVNFKALIIIIIIF